MTTTAISAPQTLTSTRSPAHGEAGGKRERRAAWLFSTPFLVVYIAFLIGPVLIGLVISFFNTTTVKGGIGNWVGLSNYKDVLGNADFWRSMWHSALFTIFTTPILVLLPLLFAILASRIKHGRTFYRLAFFAPYVVPSAAVALIFAWMYTPQIGLVGKVFGWFGLSAPNFLGSTSGGWFAVVLLTVWWTFGFNFILYTAAISDISEEVYEAAVIDGASPGQQIRLITVPLLRPTIGLVFVLQLLASLKVFDQIYLLLQGGPNYSTRPVIEYIYDTGFTAYRGGYAAAATMVYFLLLVLISAAWLLFTRRRDSAPALREAR